MRVLIVDDDPLMRDSLKDILESLGAGSITEACNGDVAVAIVRIKPDGFDLIFCDLQMPGRDGVATMHEFAELGVTSHIALMSGAGEAALAAAVEIAKQLNLNIAGSMPKPRITRGIVKSLLANAAIETA